MKGGWVGILGVCCLLAACSKAPGHENETERVGESRHALIGGFVADDSLFPAVFYARAVSASANKVCTATKVGDHHFLTAGRCVDHVVPGDSYFVSSKNSDPETELIRLAIAEVTRPAAATAPVETADIALVRVHQDTPSMPLALLDTLPIYAGESAFKLGYGCEALGITSFTPRLKVALSAKLDTFEPYRPDANWLPNHFPTPWFNDFGDPGRLCAGDSGSPVLRDAGSPTLVVGVNSISDGPIIAFDRATRVDGAAQYGPSTLLVTKGARTRSTVLAASYTYPTPTAASTVEAEAYDLGGEGAAYHDTTPGNSGTAPAFRTGDVDVNAALDASGGKFVRALAGEWLRFTINGTVGGAFDLKLRVAGTPATSAFQVELDGQAIGGLRDATTISAGAWTWLLVPGVQLATADNSLVLRFSQPLDFDRLEFVPSVAPSCSDGSRNGLESGTDCGGNCVPCSLGTSCYFSADCASTRCASGVCIALAAPGEACAAAAECASGICGQTSLCLACNPTNADDGNSCTADSCDGAGHVTHSTLTDGTACDDANACTTGEQCAGGTCVGVLPSLADGIECTDDVCDPLTGVISHPPALADTPCSAIDACHDEGACDGAGRCLPGEPLAFDDGDPCTIETCDPVMGLTRHACQPIDQTVPTTTADTNTWIYSGTDPLQTGVAAGTIQRTTAAVLHGRVLSESGFPLGGVRVSILNHDELGSTTSQTNGEYTMAVNGGGSLELQFSKEAFLKGSRTIDLPWGSQLEAGEIVLVQADPVVSYVDLLDTSQAFQVAAGSPIADADGPRQGVALIPAGVVATQHDSEGSHELDEMNIRITEFTAGAAGRARMPAALPALSGYTYAFEINADEAASLDARSITFSQPLVYYVDNFLAFPSGTEVPLGSFDRDTGVWVAEKSGIVITIVSETAGLADVSIDDDAAAETAPELLAVGIDAAERAKLASLYDPGRSLWRVLIPHFTQPYDLNWGVIPPPDATYPPPHPPAPTVPNSCEDANASTIECQNQILRESVGVAGTPFSLTYSSQRVPGWQVGRIRDIPLTAASVPDSLVAVDLSVQVAGRKFRQILGPSPNQSHTFIWDGLDALQRGGVGSQQAKITVSFVYQGVYGPTNGFGGLPSGGALTGNKSRGEIYFDSSVTAALENWDQRNLGLGGWSLSPHHTYDPVGQVLHRGDGTKQSATTVGLVATARKLSTVGNGFGPRSVATASDGSIYLIGGHGPSSSKSTIAKVAPNGSISIVAGKLGNDGYAGDNGLATQAVLNYPEDAVAAPDGSLYIADTRNHRIRKVSKDGTIRTIAGTGTSGFAGDGGPAVDARLNWPRGIALGADGALYVADRDNGRIRRIGTNGNITTVAGGSTSCPAPLPLDVPLRGPGDCMNPYDVAVEADGGLLVADGTRGIVRRVTPQGRVRTVAGMQCIGCPQPFDGAKATLVGIGNPERIAARPDGGFFLTNTLGMSNSYLQSVDRDGVLRLVSGGGNNVDSTNGASARSMLYPLALSVALGPQGIVIGDEHSNRFLTLTASSLPPLGEGPMTVASADGSEVYSFDAQGRHQQTRDSLTGAVRYQFSYSNGLLATVTDAYSSTTTVERNPAGVATAIVGPYGQRTTLSYDSNGYLSGVTNPLTQSVGMSYTTTGLLTSFQNARGQSSSVQYDSRGRLLLDQDQAGGSKQLARTDLADGWQIAYTSADEGTKTFEVRQLADGQEVRSTTFSDGTVAQTKHLPSGITETTLPDRTVVTDQPGAEPRFGAETPLLWRKTRLPSGLTNEEKVTRALTLSNPADPLSVATLVDSRTINGRVWTESYNATTKTWTIESPEHRRSFRKINDKGDLVEDQAQSLLAQVLAYDARGRLSTVTQGSRQSLLTYFTSGASAGYLQTSRNPLLQTTTYTRDALGRALSELDPQSNLTGFSWDADGNLASVTPPGRPAHGMDYTPVNLMRQYTPPVLASVPDGRTVYEYNLARKLEKATRPDGLVTDYTYDAAGRLTDITTPGGTYHRDYYGLIPCTGCAAGRISQLSSPDGIALAYVYDGQFVTQTTWSGAVSGAVGFEYNSDFRVKTETISASAGSTAYQFGFDKDTLLTCASPTNCTTPGADALTLSYHANHGLPTGSAIRTVTEALGYNTTGELASQLGKFGSTTIFAETYDNVAVPRDALGRIKRKTETLDAATHTWDYTYDLAGRLETVQLDGSAFETYGYDANGNRLTVQTPSGTTSATYDNQDRLLNHGAWTYTYNANGDLATKSNSSTGQVWSYTYDVFGNLKHVVLPNSDTIDYLVDGQNRRVGKKKNGVLQKQWLYGDQLHPVAELDGSGALVARFVWASGKNTPDLVIAGGVTYRVFTDQLGSPRLLVDAATGTVGGVMRHDPWGVVLQDTVSGLMPFGFAGGIYDPETGLVRFGARDYDATVGRWVTRDSLLFKAQGANVYAYVLGNPAHAIDRTGKDVAPWLWSVPLWDGPEPGPADLIGGVIIACVVGYEIYQASGATKDRCIRACGLGIGRREAFCRSLDTNGERGRCWDAIYRGKQECVNWCQREF